LKKQNSWIWLAFIATLILTFCVIEIEPIAAIFDFVHLDMKAYGIAIGLAFLIIPIVEAYKAIMRSIEK
ncbi:MAG: cation transporting ATPase C-terminal domain-containing protein, partial [Atopobiaceae bacterium]|nr:cation transporting ATPase C-terminal domain-containing protein [Atopobiaceae bacterium]